MKTHLFPNRREVVTVLALSLAAGSYAGAQTIINFDNLGSNGGFQTVQNGYEGLNWSNFEFVDGLTYGDTPSGFAPAVLSSPNIAFNDYGNPASISSATSFNLNSAYLTAEWNNGLQVDIQGFKGGTMVDNETFTINATSPTLAEINFVGVTSVKISTSGGTPAYPGDGLGTQVAIDNISVSLVPEPSTWALVAFGGLAVGLLGWRKARS